MAYLHCLTTWPMWTSTWFASAEVRQFLRRAHFSLYRGGMTSGCSGPASVSCVTGTSERTAAPPCAGLITSASALINGLCKTVGS